MKCERLEIQWDGAGSVCGGAGGTRTRYLFNAIEALSRLSYSPTQHTSVAELPKGRNEAVISVPAPVLDLARRDAIPLIVTFFPSGKKGHIEPSP